MSFSEGDAVTVIKLKKEGVIQKALRGGRYRVAINQLCITCKEDELKASTAVQSGAHRQKRGVKKLASAQVKEIDLHGQSVEKAKELVLEFINQGVLSGETRLHIIHGHGSVKVKTGVHSLLSTLDVVKRFEISRTNSGVTVVYL